MPLLKKDTGKYTIGIYFGTRDPNYAYMLWKPKGLGMEALGPQIIKNLNEFRGTGFTDFPAWICQGHHLAEKNR